MQAFQRWRAAREAFEAHDVPVEGCTMHARRSKATPRHGAPTLVLLGGTALSGRYLLPVGAELGLRFPVWIPDLPGRGQSEAPKRAMRLEDHADHLAAWMTENGIRHACLVGNSMGCQIAVDMAVRHPQRISHLVLQGPTVDARARDLRRQIVRLLADGRHEPASLGPIEVVDWLRAGLTEIVVQSRFAVQHRIEDRLPLVRCPAVVVRGTDDAVVPRDWAERVEGLLPDGCLRQVPGAAHAMVYTHPLELARLTEAFLRGVTAPIRRA